MTIPVAAGEPEAGGPPPVAPPPPGGPAPTLVVSDQRLPEGNRGTRPMTFTVTLSAPSSTPVTVHWHTRNGTAKAGSDYLAASGTVTYQPGQTTQTISVRITGDRKRERDETFGIVLSVPAGATIADSYGLGLVLNDD
jgi:hypothetical protein